MHLERPVLVVKWLDLGGLFGYALGPRCFYEAALVVVCTIARMRHFSVIGNNLSHGEPNSLNLVGLVGLKRKPRFKNHVVPM